MKTLSMILCACALLGAGCDREDEEEARAAEGRMEDTTAKERRDETPRAEEPRAQTGAEGAPGSAQPTGEPKAEQGSSGRRAEAELDGVGDGRIEGKATLEERGGAVEVTVRLEGAAPGEGAVRVYERASCEGLEKKALPPSPDKGPQMSDLGMVTIGADGKGVLAIKKASATLQPDERTSMLGKALVVSGKSVNAPPGTARVAGTNEAVACGMIRAQADETRTPADKKDEPADEKE